VHDQPRDRPRPGRGGRLGRAGQARRPRALAPSVLRRQARADREGRRDRVGGDGGPERVDPNAPARALPPDVRRLRPRTRHRGRHVRVEGGARPGRAAPSGPRPPRGRRRQVPLDRQARYDPQQRAAADRGGPGDLRGAGRRRTAYVRASAGPADGAAVLSLLMGPEIAPVPVITHPHPYPDGVDLSHLERDALVLTAEERRWGRRRVITRAGRTLALLQLADGLFPAGGFAHSFGLETYVQEGRVGDAAGLEAFVVAHLEGGAGPCDAVAVACATRLAACGDIAGVVSLDEKLDAMK